MKELIEEVKKSDDEGEDESSDQDCIQPVKLDLSKEKQSKQFKGVMLAETFKGEDDPKGWIMSEKLDGVRCWWNGKTLYSRNKNVFHAWDKFRKSLPEGLILDGELFYKRGEFSKTISIVKKKNRKNAEWDNLKFMIFDAPELEGTFVERIGKLKDFFAKNPSKYCQVVT